MLRRGVALFGGLLVLLAVGCAAEKISAQEVARMDAATLQSSLNDPGVIVLDVRGGPPPKAPDLKITGSITEDPGAVAEWAGKYPKDKTLVLYCA